jgi:hypothetical protein
MFDKIKTIFTSRRFSLISVILIIVLLFVYLLFVSFFFDPFEDNLEDTASLLPSEVDYFIRWQDMGSQFNSFPEFSLWEEVKNSPNFDAASEAGAFKAISEKYKIGALTESLSQITNYLPVGLSLESDLLNEVAVAGRGAPSFDSNFKGVLLLRTSFKVKAGVSMLNFQFVRDKLPDALKVEDIGDDIYRIPQFEFFGFQDAYLGRVKDVLLLASEKEYINIAKELDKRRGQDSLAQASVFHDNVSAHLNPGAKPLEVFFRWSRDTASIPEWPRESSLNIIEKFFSKLFSSKFMRVTAGFAELKEGLRFRLGGDTDLSFAKPYQKNWLEGNAVSRRRLEKFSSMVPAASFSFSSISGDVGNLLKQVYSVLPNDLRSMMESEVARGSDYQSMPNLLESIGQIFKPGLALSLHVDDFKKLPTDPPNDGAPMPLFALLGEVQNYAAYDHLKEYLQSNWAKFTGDANQSIQSITFGGGARGTSFVSQIIPGTGEIILLYIPTLETLLVSNSAKYASEIITTAFLSPNDPSIKRRQLYSLQTFKKSFANNPNGAHLFTWLAPQKAQKWFDDLVIAEAEIALQKERESVWRSQRPAIEKNIRSEKFGGREVLSAQENQALQRLVDQALIERDVRSQERLNELAIIARQKYTLLTLLKSLDLSFHGGRRYADVMFNLEIFN